MKTIKELAQNALDIQNACNIVGIVNSFARNLEDLQANLRESMKGDFKGSDLWKHPITLLWLCKLNDLAGVDMGSDISKAFSWIYDNVGKEGN